MDEHEAKRVRQESAMKISGLVVLLARAGGRLAFTQAEQQEACSMYGGTANLAIHMETTRIGDAPPVIELTLVRKAPANADLPT